MSILLMEFISFILKLEQNKSLVNYYLYSIELRLRNVVLCLAENSTLLWDTSIIYAWEVRQNFLKIFSLNELSILV